MSIAMSRTREEPSEWSPRDAVNRYLRRRRSDATEATVYSYKYRLKLFVEWLDGLNLDHVGQIEPYDFDEYFNLRSGDVSPSTLENEMRTIRLFIEYLEDVGAVDRELSKSVQIPNLDREDRVNDKILRPRNALKLIEGYREDEALRSTRAHVLLELLWYIGARKGGIRALDVRDVNLEEAFVEFHHRPETGTPLKNKREGERPVGIPENTVDVLREYLADHRIDIEDDHGRQPLLSSRYGRPAKGTIRDWAYLATLPCLFVPCPHGRDRPTCDWTEYGQASKCPSSRSPHPIRSGSITYQLNIGFPPSVVAERVNADVPTIEDHYDWATNEERWSRYHDRLEVRRPYINELDQNNEME